MKSLVIKKILLMSCSLTLHGQADPLEEMYRLLGETVRGEKGILASREATAQICKSKPDLCLVAKLEVAMQLKALGTSESRAEAIRSLDEVLTSMSPKETGRDIVVNNLAILYESESRFREAEELYREALDLREAEFGQKHAKTAASLNNMGLVLSKQGKYDAAEPFYLQALKLRIQLLGRNDRATAESISNLAQLYLSRGKYEEAERLNKDAVSIRREILGPRHADTASSLSNLGGVYLMQGRLELAEPLFEEALGIRREALGERHPDVAEGFTNLSAIYQAQGRYSLAASNQMRAFDIQKGIYGNNHPATAGTLNNLGHVFTELKQYKQAEEYLQLALSSFQQIYGEKHPSTATCLNNLGALYNERGESEKAEVFYAKALLITETTLGKEHPDTAGSLSNLATALAAQGKTQEAETYYKRALIVHRAAFGQNNPLTSTYLSNLGTFYMANGKGENAIPLLSEALQVLEGSLDSQFSAMNDATRRDFVDQLDGERSSNLTFGFSKASPGAEGIAARSALLFKGLRLHSTRQTILRLESDLGSTAQANQSRLESLEQSIAGARAKLFRLPPEQRADARAAGEARLVAMERERGELRLAFLKDAAGRKLQGRVGFEDLREKLQEGEAFLEVEYFREFLAKEKVLAKRFGAYQYGVIVFRKTGEPVLINLGEATRINELLADVRKMGGVTGKDTIWGKSNGRLVLKKATELADHRLRYQAKVRELWKLVLGPVEAKLGAAEFAAVKRWVVCPDGPLHGLAWETLRDGQGRYLRQRAQVRYVESPRTFVFRNEETATGKPLYVHSPDYGSTRESGKKEGSGLWSAGLTQLQRGLELGKAMQRVHADVEILTGAAASEERLRKLEDRKEVVIYTHGEYLQGPMGTDEDLGRVRIALAGAAKEMGKREEIDGTLTASDVAAWRLRGAELVALVGCETGVGSGDVGEGLQGMRRALYLAGSKWQLLSLWTVVDAAAEIWMEHFYEKRKLNPKLGIPEVVDLVQKDFLSGKVKPKRADGTDLGMDHPLLWAGMTLNGQ